MQEDERAEGGGSRAEPRPLSAAGRARRERAIA